MSQKIIVPFAIDEKKLKELIAEISGSLIGESIGFDKLAIRLPSANDLPVPSPQLIRCEDEPLSIQLFAVLKISCRLIKQPSER